MTYILHILVMVAIYVILTVSLDLVAGQAGLLSLAHAGFYGLGAYTSAILTVDCGMSFAVGTLAGVGLATVASALISLPTLRLRDDYFVIATFGFQVILLSIFVNWTELTRGPLGIAGIQEPTILGWRIRSGAEYLVVVAILAGLACGIVWRISCSPFGRVLRAIREDEIFAQAAGKNALRYKVAAFAVSAGLAALAGSLYAHYTSYIDPGSFTPMESVLVVSMVVLGGPDSRWGPIIGAASLVILPEALRFVGLPSSVAANLRQILYGILLVITMVVRPRGLLGRYGFGR